MEERVVKVASGWTMLVVVLALWAMIPIGIIYGAVNQSEGFIFASIALFPVALIFSLGLFSLQPNQARVLVLFGKYAGTVREDGFHWANPFSVKRGGMTTVPGADGKPAQVVSKPSKFLISLRQRNFETAKLKVNDLRGNPIEISAVVVWRVQNTAQALFDVDAYEHYVTVQSESAVRQLAGIYPYDHASDHPGEEITLRESGDVVNQSLQKELHERLQKAGVIVEEARLNHLAYAPEIAGAMLRRQQAEAIIAARKKIVHGAVSMVEMALDELAEKKILELDDERKAAMVGNLLVILCGETEAHPVINTGTLYG